MDQRKLITEWFAEHRQALLTFLTRRVGCWDTAADLAQETALRLHLRSRHERIEYPVALGVLIATQLSIDHGRKHAVRARYEDPVADPLAVPIQRPGPEEVCAHRQRLERLADSLVELPDSCRTALELSLEEGLSYAQIAKRMGISKRMVAKHLARALTHCRLHAGE